VIDSTHNKDTLKRSIHCANSYEAIESAGCLFLLDKGNIKAEREK
jgi:hypothetical protein